MLTPFRKYVNSPVRVAANFQTDDGADVDPATVTLRVMSPENVETSYVYGVDSEVVKANVGDYYADITPDASGRWAYRWQATGSGTTIAFEGWFRVMWSPFYESVTDAYRS